MTNIRKRADKINFCRVPGSLNKKPFLKDSKPEPRPLLQNEKLLNSKETKN